MNDELEQSCPMTLQVQRLFDGELPEEEMASARVHLDSCELCRAFYESLGVTALLFQQIRAPGAEWQAKLTRQVAAATANDLRFVRRLTGIAAVLVAGFSALTFTLSSRSSAAESSPFAEIDQWSRYASASDTELGTTFVKELSETNQ